MEAKYYQTITELPLSKYIECLVDKNLYSLVISGDPNKEALSKAWERILLDYNDAMGDSETKLYFQLMKEKNILLLTLKEIEVDIQILSYSYDKKSADQLNELLDTDFDFTITDRNKYFELLKRCERRSGGIFIQYELKNSEFEAVKAKGEDKNFKPTREYFQSLLVTLSDHAKFQIDENITVFMFCERVKRFGQHIKLTEDNAKRR